MADHRWPVVVELFRLIRLHPDIAPDPPRPAVQAEVGFPGEDQHQESIWAGVLSNEGAMDVPVFGGGEPTIVNDDWELPIYIALQGRTAPVGANRLDATALRLGVLTSAVTDVVRANAALDGAEDAGRYVLSIVPSRRSDSVGDTTEGVVGFCELTVAISSRLQEDT